MNFRNASPEQTGMMGAYRQRCRRRHRRGVLVAPSAHSIGDNSLFLYAIGALAESHDAGSTRVNTPSPSGSAGFNNSPPGLVVYAEVQGQ